MRLARVLTDQDEEQGVQDILQEFHNLLAVQFEERFQRVVQTGRIIHPFEEAKEIHWEIEITK